jgi:hypothetical protein
MSNLELANTIPVSPPSVNRKMKPKTHSRGLLSLKLLPKSVLIHLKTLIPVGIAIIIVAEVK